MTQQIYEERHNETLWNELAQLQSNTDDYKPFSDNLFDELSGDHPGSYINESLFPIMADDYSPAEIKVTKSDKPSQLVDSVNNIIYKQEA